MNTYAYVGGNSIRNVDPYGLVILLQTHGVYFGAEHSKLTIVPDNQAKYQSDPRFPNTLPDGRVYATMGGGPEPQYSLAGNALHLVADSNRVRDVNLNDNKFSSKCFYNDGMSEDEVIEELFRNLGNYNDNQNYQVFPSAGSGGYNSNSLIRGLMNSANLWSITPSNTPDFNTSVPSSHFIP